MDSKNIRIIFFLPADCDNEPDTSEEMQQAYEACKQNGIKVEWIPESDYKSLTLKKTDIAVFQNFNGTCFEKVQSTKSVIVGPWCILTCLTQGIPIPNFPWPIYSVAMNGCTIATSALPKIQRVELQTKIQHMGGFYSQDLVRNCTHLVTDTVKSEKYIKAAETGLKLVLPSWVYDVWDASCKGNIHCNDENFISKHRCPAFHKLVICCTGLNMAQRTELAKSIEENGGTYKEQLHCSTTDILVCSSATASTKYSAAKKRNIKCVSIDWVKDSIKNGYAMPDTQYTIKINTSTPNKDTKTFLQPDFSMISNIGNATSHTANSNDTIEATVNLSMLPPPSSRKRKSDDEHNMLVNAINMQTVKMAGPFLDGCGIYLAGFGVEQREKLMKIVNFGGATRYDDVSERVTHIIVGSTSSHEYKLLTYKDSVKNISVVHIQWLLDSLVAEHPVHEDKYIITSSNLPNPDSPLSKKALHVMRQDSSSHLPAEESQPQQEEEEEDVVKQYLRPNTSGEDDTLAKLLQNVGDFQSKQNAERTENNKRPTTSTDKRPSVPNKDDSLSSAVDDSSQPSDPIFENLKFIIAGFTEDLADQLKDAVQAMHGQVMSKSYNGVADYAVVPVFSKELLKKPVGQVVTDLWITECWQENEIRPVEYFHVPISIKDDVNPLKGCVITISNYINYERNFLRNLIKELGGICQEQLSKITCTKTGVTACTHLVTPDTTGKKYAAAIKWKMFVVNKDWLLECARTSKREPEEAYSVGERKSISNTAIASTVQIETPFKNHIDTSKPKSTPNIPTTSKQTPIISNLWLTKDSNGQPAVNKTPSMVQQNNNLDPDHSSVNNQFQNNITTNNPRTSSSPITPVQTILAEARRKHLLGTAKKTPGRVLQNVQNTSEVSSQVTPVHSILAEVKKTNLLGTPERLPYPKPWDHVDTPDTPLGAFIRANPSPRLRKEMQRYLNTFPDRKPRRDSTPLSELKQRLWDKILPTKTDIEQPNFSAEEDESGSLLENNCTPSKSVPVSVVNDQLQQFYDMLTASGGGRDSAKSSRQSIIPVAASEMKDSQPNTIGWDYSMDSDTTPVFMFTGLEMEVRQSMTEKLESIGATVVELGNFDPKCTHLICPKPTRSEKILASMAAGKWILHLSYVDACLKEGKLVDEEPFEFGNPKSLHNPHLQTDKENDGKLAAIHYWRKEIQRRGYGPFHDMKAIVVSKRKESLVRILQAGGALVIDANPPFSERIHATHCILDLKSISDISAYIPLAKRGVYCVNIVFINDYLQRTVFDAKDAIISDLVKYY